MNHPPLQLLTPRDRTALRDATRIRADELRTQALGRLLHRIATALRSLAR